MKDEFDYNNYDRLSLALKTETRTKILAYYEKFGWEIYEEKEDKHYLDIIHVKLCRPHKIKNKDKLQLLQVKMEALVNRFALIVRDKHFGTLVSSLTAAILGAAFFGLGIALAVINPALPFTVLGVISAVIGVAVPVSLIPLFRRSYKLENRRFIDAFNRIDDEIEKILDIVAEARGDGNE